MIHTVFSTTANDAMQWQSELLEYTWGRVKQPGELVRLVATTPGETLPRHHFARVVPTLAWSPHPYTGDVYAAYNKAASLLEWLFAERVEGTILLLEPDCVFRSPVATQVQPGQARATAWPGLPRNQEGPFGLGPGFAYLESFCVDRSLKPQPVTLPLLIHSSDLRQLAARWLELMSIIRVEIKQTVHGSPRDADEIAYAIAAAEAQVPHAVANLGVETDAGTSQAPILHYRRPIESERGEIVWDKRAYTGWEPVDAQRARAGTGRDFLLQLAAYISSRETGGDLALLRPRQRDGVRQGRVLDQTVLEVPGRSDSLSLNPSAAAVWELCDGENSLSEIARQLEGRFAMPPGSLRADLHAVIDRLERVGAIELEPA